MTGVNGLSIEQWLLEPFGGRGRVAVLVRDDVRGSVLAQARPDDSFESASMIKLAILATLIEEARRGALDLDASLTTGEPDRAPGDGILKEWSLPLPMPIRDLAAAMIVLSDNTATNALLRLLGVDEVNGALDRWGFTVTRSRGAVRPRAPGEPGIGVTTARETVALLDGLRLGRFGTRGESAWAMTVLEHQQDDRAMSRYLTPGARCAHKTGTVEAIRHDAGVLLAPDGAALATAAFLSEGVGEPVEGHDHPAVQAIGHATARLVRALGLPVPLVPWAPI